MGWNELTDIAPHPVLAGIRPGLKARLKVGLRVGLGAGLREGFRAGLELAAHAYFVHSYQFRLADSRALLAITDYGGPIAAAVGRDNLFGVQFHPEKSQATGLRMIANFLRWRP